MRRRPNTTDIIEARLAGPLDFPATATLPEWIMWMPGGEHEIHATDATGRPVRMRVLVNPRTASTAQKGLSDLIRAGRKPYLDFNHKNDAASGYPQEFQWRDTPRPGVYCRVDWSQPGAEAVTGRAYCSFSPTFAADRSQTPAIVCGMLKNMGGLVNDPAFHTMLPHFAKENPSAMKKSEQIIALLTAINRLHRERGVIAAKGGDNATAALQAKDAEIAAKETELTALRAEGADPEGDDNVTLNIQDASRSIAAKDAEIAALTRRAQEAENSIKARRTEDAKNAVQAAVARGVIPAQDTARQAAWQSRIEADPTLATELAQMGGSPINAGRMFGGGTVQIVSEDTRRVVQAYHAAGTAMERGVIYAKDIRGRLAKGDELVISAANTLGGVTGNLIVQRSLDLLKTEFPILRNVSTDFSGDNAAFGQTLKTRLLTPPAVTDYSTSTGYSSSNVVTTDVDITISAHKAGQIEFNANELASTRRLLIDEQREGIHFSLGEVMVQALYALFTVANYDDAAGKTVKALNSFARPTLTACAKALNLRKVPKAGRSFLLNSDYFEALSNDSAIVALATQQRAGLLEEYALPKIAGFQPFEAVDLPTTGNLVGVGLAPSAVAIATRPPSDYTLAIGGLPSTALISTVTNPDTGVTVMLAQFVDHMLGKAVVRVALMYGVAVGNKKCAQLLTSA